jgi:hypothetical protein
MKIFVLIIFLTIFFIDIGDVTGDPYGTWWDSEWEYVKILNISENSGNDLIDYPIIIENLSCANNCNNDGSDIRVIADDNKEIQNALLKNNDNSWNISFKINISKNTNNVIYKIYFGNNKAESKNISWGDILYDVYDDFNDNNFNTMIWDNVSRNDSWVKEYNGILSLHSNKGNDWRSRGKIFTKQNFTNFVAEFDAFDPDTASVNNDVTNFEYRSDRVLNENGGAYNGYWILWWEDSKIEIVRSINYPINSTALDVKIIPYIEDENWTHWKIVVFNESHKIYINHELTLQANNSDIITPGGIGFYCREAGHFYAPFEILIDNVKIKNFVYPEPTYTILDAISINPKTPQPTEHSLVLTTTDFRNIMTITPTRLPLLVVESLSPEAEKFITEYQPDYIFTLGFSAGLNNSYEIDYEDIPKLFFPNATMAIHAESRDKAILGSAIAHYMGIPFVFETDDRYEIIDLENKTIDEIQDLYVQMLKEKGENTNYLVLANLSSDAGMLAGYLAGMRKGFIVPINDGLDPEGVSGKIKESIQFLADNGMYSKSLDYKKGGPLYIAILGGNGSIPFYSFKDPGFEMLDDRDGDTLYSDIMYGNVGRGGLMDLAVGRLDGGPDQISLNLARQRLPLGNKAVLVAEYKYPKVIDVLNGFGGMSQAFMLDEFVLNRTETERIVEKRVDVPKLGGSIDDFVDDVSKIAVGEALGMIFGLVWTIPSLADAGIPALYTIFEFDWDPWLHYPGGTPDHLPVIGPDLNDRFSGADIVGYFGVGDKYWLIPGENRDWKELYFSPYGGASNFTRINFSGFLYDDHDMSAGSEIKKQVAGQGGSVLAASGMVHDPYAAATSAFFFKSIESGKSLGESYTDMVNEYPHEFPLILLYPSWPMPKMKPHLQLKDITERILFADPAYRPLNVSERPASEKQEFSVGPSGSFTAVGYMESNYTIANRRLDVFNADSYIVEQEKPLVPVFVRKFILPTGASIESVRVDTDYSRQASLDRNVAYNDSHYTNYTALILGCMQKLGLGNAEPGEKDESRITECLMKKAEPAIKYPYPNQNYWSMNRTLLDGRIEVYVYVPAVIYEARTAKVLEDAKMFVEYDSKLDMDIDAADVPVGADGTIKITLINQGGDMTGNLYVWVEGVAGTWNFTDSVSMSGSGTIPKEFSFTPETKGIYRVKALLDAGSVVIGPRMSYFEAGETEFKLSKKFRPAEVRLIKKTYVPPVNFPEISVSNIGILNITSVKVTDSLPAGFTVPGYNSARHFEFENESFVVDSKIPVFVFMVTDQEGREKRLGGLIWPPGKKIKMLNRKYYNATVSGGRLSISTEEFSRTNFGRSLEDGDALVIKYMMMSGKGETPGNLATVTSATVFTGAAHSEKSITSELRVR